MLDTKACCVHAVCCVAWGVLWVVVCCIVSMAVVLLLVRATLTLAAEDKTTRSLASCCKLCRTGTCWKKNSLELLRDESVQMCLVGGLTCLWRGECGRRHVLVVVWSGLTAVFCLLEGWVWAQRAGGGVKWTDWVFYSWWQSVGTTCW